MAKSSRIAEVRSRACPWCGELILLNQSARETLHRAPVCQQWLDYCRGQGATYNGLAQVESVKPTN